MNACLTPMSLSSYPLLHYLGALRVPKGGFLDPVGWLLGPSKAQVDQRFIRVSRFFCRPNLVSGCFAVRLAAEGGSSKVINNNKVYLY